MRWSRVRFVLPWLLLVLLLPAGAPPGSLTTVAPSPVLSGLADGHSSLSTQHSARVKARAGRGAEGGTLYVANLRSADVSVLTLPDGRERARVPVAFNPHELAPASRDAVLVTNYRSGAVTRLTLPDLAASPIALGGEPHGVAVAGPVAAVTLGRAGEVALVDAVSGHVRARVPTGGEPHMAAAWGDFVYVADAAGGALLEIDPAAPAEGTTRPPARAPSFAGGARYGGAAVTRRVPVGATPESLDVSPDGATIAVANARSGDVSLVDRERFAERARVPVPGAPVRVRYHPAGRTLAVSLNDAGQVALLDIDGAVTALIPVGNRPDGLAFSPDGRLLYVALTGDNRVAVVDVTRRRVVRTLPAGDGPSGLLLLP
jgi:YVTN family beta-propeller protein